MLSAVGERVDMGTVHMHCRNKMSNKDAELTGAKHETQKTACFFKGKESWPETKQSDKQKPMVSHFAELGEAGRGKHDTPLRKLNKTFSHTKMHSQVGLPPLRVPLFQNVGSLSWQPFTKDPGIENAQDFDTLHGTPLLRLTDARANEVSGARRKSRNTKLYTLASVTQ